MPHADAPAVTLDQVLSARELRAAHQRALLARYPDAALVSLTVNMPGSVKLTPESRRVFYAGLAALQGALADASLPLLYAESRLPDTGGEAYLAVCAAPDDVKRLTCSLEQTLPYGRLLDIDVLGPAGAPLSRTELGFPARGCMVCGKQGAYCASRRAHPLTEILSAFYRLAALAPEEIS